MATSLISVLHLCVLIAALMPIVCVGLAKSKGFGIPVDQGGYDNGAPRQWLASQTGWRARANAAQSNCFEAFPFFLGALALAQQAGAPVGRLEFLAMAYVALRIIYVGLYLTDRASARSLVWVLALAANIAILFSGAPLN